MSVVNSSAVLGALAGLLLLGGLAGTGDEVPMSWNGRRFTAAQIPEEFPARARTAVELWKPWALPGAYRLDFDPDARVFLATRRTSGKSEAQMRLVQRAETWFDELFHASGTDAAPTGAILVLKDEKAHAEALGFLGKIEPGLASWAQKAAGKELGFVLSQPMCGAFVEGAPGLKEWNPDHELLNRTVQVLLLRRDGTLPHWLAQGLAWEAEQTVFGSIWCYPHRSGFVAHTEHEAWPGQLAAELENEAITVYSVDALAAWRRGTYDAEAARHAWGIAHYLAREKKDVLGDVLEDLRALREKEGRTTHPDGSWELVTGYEIPAKAQAEILAKRCGEGWIDAAKAWSRKNAAAR